MYATVQRIIINLLLKLVKAYLYVYYRFKKNSKVCVWKMRENLYPKLQAIYKTTSDTFEPLAVADFEFFLKIFLNFYSSVNAGNRDDRSVLLSA